jgi:hypothetical protein
MLSNRDDLLLAIMSELDDLDADALAAEFDRLSPAPIGDYSFVFRSDRMTTRTFAAFVESAFLKPQTVAVWH